MPVRCLKILKLFCFFSSQVTPFLVILAVFARYQGDEFHQLTFVLHMILITSN